LVGLRHTQNDCPAPAGFFSLVSVMALWGLCHCGRSDVLPRPGGGSHEIAPRGDETDIAHMAGRGMAQPPQFAITVEQAPTNN